MINGSQSAKALVNSENGEISREIFVNHDFYRQELEQIFGRAWLYIGHESQVKKPGDFFVSKMGEESVILCRDRGGKIHVFLNSCRHRGMKVCRYDEGNTTNFICPYHAWSYSTDGKLVGVQNHENLMHNNKMAPGSQVEQKGPTPVSPRQHGQLRPTGPGGPLYGRKQWAPGRPALSAVLS